MVFGMTQPDYENGLLFDKAQFTDEEHVDGKAAGTYHDVRIDLTTGTNPLTFNIESFNQIFGTLDSDPNDMIPTGFELYFNKSQDAPLVVYIDNVRVGLVPEPASLVLSATALAGLLIIGWRWRKFDRWFAVR
ncbi:MAG TPA: PEP-CTERM sorting domain-containing protein [Pirellulales bacterium]|jgi:hypothetical protein|nr:PEP-CTERM sorting domain-containing protein [Pirellulales bacterium]